MARPLVAESRRVLTPFMPRDGTSYCTVTMPALLAPLMSSSIPLRWLSRSMALPAASSGSSMSTSSKGSWRAPSICCSMTLGGPTMSSYPSRRMFSMSTVRWSSPRPETCTVSASTVSSILRATLVSSSFSRRSLMTRMVSFLPTLPATADLLTPKVIDMVGCSTVIGSSGLGSLRSTTVSPMLKFSMPAKVTMSPAEASSTGVLPMASKAKSSVTLTLSTLQPGPALSPTCCALRITPERMRPMPSLPMKLSLAMFEICSWSEPSRSALGLGRSRIFRKRGPRSLVAWSGSSPATRLMAEVYTIGKSVCSSLAPSSQKRSKVLSTTEAGSASGLSILLITTRMRWPMAIAFLSTKRVCGLGPSCASTSSSTPSTMLSTRSTSPPKSA
mmetsp:Transcript_18830/g.44728  ORF Transcript_18830/g.44728 Transcript_18830/m.44728 type:complete len:388 (-) Transcript_18830:412-1575(-)